jgi:glucokinase
VSFAEGADGDGTAPDARPDNDAPVLAVAVEPGRLAAGIVDRHGAMVVRDRITIPPRDVWRGLEGLIRRVIAAAPAGVERPRAVGVSCTGPIDIDAGAVSPNAIEAWRAFPLAGELETLTGLPVHLDSRAAALAESARWTGFAGESESYLVLLLDATIESSCVVEGVRLRGAHGNAASLAHVTVDPNGLECWCGARGCLTAYATASAIEREQVRPLRRATESIIERTGIMVGRALASALALLDVPTVFFSGNVVEVFGDAMIEPMRRELATRSRLPGLSELDLVEMVDQPAALIGAAALARTTAVS